MCEYKEEMVYPEKSEGLGGLGFDEHDLLQSATNLHAKSLRETSLKYGKLYSSREITGYGALWASGMYINIFIKV